MASGYHSHMLSLALSAAILDVDTEFRAMSFNIWVGGTRHQPISQTVKAIEAAKADIVGIQEPGSSLAAIAEGLKWNKSEKAAIVTKFEILEDWKVEGNRHGGARIKLSNGKEVIVYNDHFTAYPYGPYEVRDGKAKTVEDVVKVEENSGRVKQMRAILTHIDKASHGLRPIVITGDFNTPSHLDWVNRTRSRTFGMVMPWPVTVEAEKAGFTDSFRTLHRDPASKPGFTWSPGYPVPNIEKNDVMDRIDFVLYRGALRVKKSEVVGETGPISDIALDPWPSDHRAVVTTFLMN